MNSSSTISTNNYASNLVITNGDSYNGTYDNLMIYQSVQISVNSTKNLTMTLYFSNDSIQTISSSNISITANITYNNSFQIRNKYFKVSLTNSSESSATVSLTTKLVQTPTNTTMNITYNNFFNSYTMNSVSLETPSTTNYTSIPNGTNFCIIKAVGGGGGGGSGGDNASDSCGGGGAGAYAEIYLCENDLSGYTHIKTIVGAAGTSTNSTTIASTGGTGGITSVSLYNYVTSTNTNLLDCSGGYGGYTAGTINTTFYSLGGFGGTATIYPPFTNRGFTKTGMTGDHGWTAGTAYSTSIFSGNGANSELGTGGHHLMGAAATYTVPTDNVSFGGGGFGGIYNLFAPGNGGPGKVVIIFLS